MVTNWDPRLTRQPSITLCWQSNHLRPCVDMTTIWDPVWTWQPSETLCWQSNHLRPCVAKTTIWDPVLTRKPSETLCWQGNHLRSYVDKATIWNPVLTRQLSETLYVDKATIWNPVLTRQLSETLYVDKITIWNPVLTRQPSETLVWQGNYLRHWVDMTTIWDHGLTWQPYETLGWQCNHLRPCVDKANLLISVDGARISNEGPLTFKSMTRKIKSWAEMAPPLSINTTCIPLGTSWLFDLIIHNAPNYVLFGYIPNSTTSWVGVVVFVMSVCWQWHCPMSWRQLGFNFSRQFIWQRYLSIQN